MIVSLVDYLENEYKIHINLSIHLIAELDDNVPEVSLQSLLENGAISAEDFAAAVNAASADGRGQIIGEDGQVLRYVVEHGQQIKEELGKSEQDITSADRKKACQIGLYQKTINLFVSNYLKKIC